MLRSNTSSLASSSSDWEFALVKIVLEPTCKCITFNTNLIWWLCFFLIVTSPLWWEITSPANNWSWTWSPPSSLFDDFIYFFIFLYTTKVWFYCVLGWESQWNYTFIVFFFNFGKHYNKSIISSWFSTHNTMELHFRCVVFLHFEKLNRTMISLCYWMNKTTKSYFHYGIL